MSLIARIIRRWYESPFGKHTCQEP